MPAVAAKTAKILVTGANGFIAVWLVQDLLEKGYTVRGTVRSEAKGAHLLKLFKSFVDAGKFELVIVPDITAPGAFNEAVKGIDAIEHTASPFHFDAEDPKELTEPAVKGTVGILESAAAYAGNQLKRIVVTSSGAAITDSTASGVLDESNWNESDIKEINEKGKAASQLAKYRASKSLAEKAAWDFYKTNKDKLTWDLVTINPSYVFGPMLHEISSTDQLNTSNKVFYDSVLSGKKKPEELEEFSGNWVDVRDVSDAHVKAIEVEGAGGNRFIINTSGFIWQEWFDVVNELKLPGVSAAIGTPGRGNTAKYHIVYNHARAESILGMKFRSKAECARDTIKDFQSRGWLST